MTNTTIIAAGLELARKLLNDDRVAFVQCHIVPEAGLSADDQAIADDYTAAIAAITGAAAELRTEHAQRVTAERDELVRQNAELAARLAEIERAELARELPNSITAAIADFRDACIACAISECSDHDRDPDYTSADRAEECLRDELQRLTAERDELAARLAEIEAQEPVAWVPIHPRTGPLWSMTTGSPDEERLPHYPLKPLYTRPATPAAKPCRCAEAVGEQMRQPLTALERELVEALQDLMFFDNGKPEYDHARGVIARAVKGGAA